MLHKRKYSYVRRIRIESLARIVVRDPSVHQTIRRKSACPLNYLLDSLKEAMRIHEFNAGVSLELIKQGV